MANQMETQIKKLSLALGAVVDGAYLWAGADKSIKAEMSGRDNGDIIYFKVTNLGNASTPAGIANPSTSPAGNGATYGVTASSVEIKQTTIPVQILDTHIMYEVKAFEKQCTSIGTDLARARVGQKLAKAAIKATIASDIENIGNIFVGDSFEAFQLAGAYMKSFCDGELYGFMDWQAWGKLTATGQQAVPCALAKPEFGKELVGSWTLINQLRTIPDIPTVKFVAKGSATVTASIANNQLTLTIGGSGAPTSGCLLVDLGVAMKDTNDIDTTKNWQVVVDLAKLSSGKKVVDMPAWAKNAGITSVTPTIVDVTAGTYAATIIRAEGAQAFGTMNSVPCEGADYSKSTVESITVHENKESDVVNLKTYDRFDMVYAAKLVEPRAACVVYYKIG